MINEKLVVELWDWIDLLAGTDDYPAWHQGEWGCQMRTAVANLVHRQPEAFENRAVYGENYCGAAFCLAGYALQGHHILDQNGLPTNYLKSWKPIVNHEGQEYTPAGPQDWWSAGAHMLGITWDEAVALFKPENTKERIRELFNRYLERYGSEVRV